MKEVEDNALEKKDRHDRSPKQRYGRADLAFWICLLALSQNSWTFNPPRSQTLRIQKAMKLSRMLDAQAVTATAVSRLINNKDAVAKVRS